MPDQISPELASALGRIHSAQPVDPRPARPTGLPDFAGMEEEHAAWRLLCERLAGVVEVEKAAQVLPVDLNAEHWHPAIDAIRLWGERLVDLRLGQDAGTRASALDDAVTLVVDGRPS